MSAWAVEGRVFDVVAGRSFPARVTVSNGTIRAVEPLEASVGTDALPCIVPGLIDAHIHIESSMLSPSNFARAAVRFGTIGTISDPHEIANVCGLDGVQWMLDDAAKTPFKFTFGAPSCVPATDFEESGARLDAQEIEYMLRRMPLPYLSEMMNFPGVIAGVPEVDAKLVVARGLGKPIDGHAPGVRGEALDRYIAAGISTDHESFTLEEALEKAEKGMKILLREGSAAKNFDALWPVAVRYPNQVMLCSDDLHPDSLLEGHLDVLIRRGLHFGLDAMTLLRAATLNPVRHYRLKCGLLQVGDPADMVIVDSIESFQVQATYIDGQQVFDGQRVHLSEASTPPINTFNAHPVTPDQLEVKTEGASGRVKVNVIDAIDGQIVTGRSTAELRTSENGAIQADIPGDVLRIVVVNRYRQAPIAAGFIRNFGLQSGALASTVAHDSHNIVAVGCDTQSLAKAINRLIELKGGLSFANKWDVWALALPVAGLLSDESPETVAHDYKAIEARVKAAGCSLAAPFMTLSFMALPVIPALKMTDKGMFDVENWKFESLVVGESTSE